MHNINLESDQPLDCLAAYNVQQQQQLKKQMQTSFVHDYLLLCLLFIRETASALCYVYANYLAKQFQ